MQVPQVHFPSQELYGVEISDFASQWGLEEAEGVFEKAFKGVRRR